MKDLNFFTIELKETLEPTAEEWNEEEEQNNLEEMMELLVLLKQDGNRNRRGKYIADIRERLAAME